jgi:Ca2+-transporting ATPase
MKYYDQDVKNVLKELDSSMDGLHEKEASKRLETYGMNKLVEGKKKSKLRKFLGQFNDLMILILIGVMILTFIYALLLSHDYTDTIVIFVVVVLNALMGFIQEEKAEVTLDGLKQYATSSCAVKRDGKIKVIDTELLVPGDIIVLNPGDKVPADARILEEVNLRVDESPLTGESVPVRKSIDKLSGELLLQDQTNMLFSGTNITDGKCIAIVVQTGMETEIGSIATSLNTPYEVKTPLQIK